MSVTIALIGNRGVGKSALIQRISKGTFDPKYTPTTDITETKLTWYTTHGTVIMDVWEGETLDAITSRGIKVDGVILMIDSPNNYVPLDGSCPIAVVFSKYDLDLPIESRILNAPSCRPGVYMVYHSSKANFRLETPFMFMLKSLVEPEIQLVSVV
jgi:hypothetical protein